jgi:hypothetical protein
MDTEADSIFWLFVTSVALNMGVQESQLHVDLHCLEYMPRNHMVFYLSFFKEPAY